MPDVMIIKEMKQDTLPVLLSGFGWGPLEEGEAECGRAFPQFNF